MKPEQNLSGTNRKQSRDLLLQRAHQLRQKRQNDRLKLHSTNVIQAYTRSYLVRKFIKEQQRLSFDDIIDSATDDVLLGKLLFFYDSKVDQNRLRLMYKKLITDKDEVHKIIKDNASYKWLIKRLLVVSLRNLSSEPIVADLALDCLSTFTANQQVLAYVVTKGYYKTLRQYIDTQPTNMDLVLHLIHRPLNILKMNPVKNTILTDFCNHFLAPSITPVIKNVLIPFLKNRKNLPYSNLVTHLTENNNIILSNSLLYCFLALEPDEYAPNADNIAIISRLSTHLYDMSTPLISIGGDNDSDIEDMEVSSVSTTEQITLADYLTLFNKADRVRRILIFFMEQTDAGDELLLSLVHLCHNLLLVYKDSIRKFMLVYMLAMKDTFLNKLWTWIQRYRSFILQASSNFALWKEYMVPVSVFCDMFTFYTETLTDTESTDTSGTFTLTELNSMSELLKNVSLNLIDLAFPMCRSGSVAVTREILHLYQSSISAIRVLHMLDMRKKFSVDDFWTRKKIHISQDLTRKNYLSKRISPFYGVIVDNEDDHLPPLSTIEQRSLAILQQLPFLVEFNNRVLLLRHLCYYSLGSGDDRLRRDFMTDNAIVVRRTHLYEDSFNKLSRRNESDLHHKVRIQFINSVGLEEAGIDGGGIFKEFINEVLKTAFDPNRGFFLLTADNMLYPNPQVHLIEENYAEHYYFIGRLIGKAIFENILVDLPLAEFFLAKLLVDRASAHFLESLDPVLYRNLLYLRDYNGDVQDLGLDFTLVHNDLGETRVMELKPDGANIPVTNYNRLEYIHRLADLKLNTQIKRQCAAFREGLDSVVPLLWLRLFNHNELQVIIGGDTQEIDIEDLRANTAYGGEFTVDHVTIELFWKILRSFDDMQKKQLLKFVTSCSRPPLLGFKELNPAFAIQSSGREDRMPTASTCLNLLKIPIITDEETLRKKLLNAIEQQAGFELS